MEELKSSGQDFLPYRASSTVLEEREANEKARQELIQRWEELKAQGKSARDAKVQLGIHPLAGFLDVWASQFRRFGRAGHGSPRPTKKEKRVQRRPHRPARLVEMPIPDEQEEDEHIPIPHPEPIARPVEKKPDQSNLTVIVISGDAQAALNAATEALTRLGK